MNCAQDLEFHMPDDSGRALDKAKESILLMKKKMFRSHDLILQYNNKLKECERLKEDLCLAQEEAIKFKRENNSNLTKVVKLEMQSADNKKIRQELEQKIVERDIQIASNKSHLQQLECKLNDVEEKHVEKEMEAELNRSALEVKTKELEQELKTLKKSHLTEVNKLEKAIKSPKEKKGKKIIAVVKETKEIGINTVEEVVQSKFVKPTTANKMVLTNEFYHIRNDPYPIFCNKCEALVESKVEKICKIMTHPPLVGNMLSPIRRRVREIQRPNNNDSNNTDLHCLNIIPKDLHRNESTRTEINLNNTRQVELNYNDNSHVDQLPRNFVSPLPSQLLTNNTVQEFQPIPAEIPVPELDNLRRKIETLERKIKKQKSQKSSDSHPSNANCCNHQHPMNYYGHSSTHVNPVSNVFPNVQTELMTEFFNKIMNIANKRDLHEETNKVSSRKKRLLRDKKWINKLRTLKKTKMLKKNNNTNWEIESDECNVTNDAEKSFDASDPTKPHLLRIKPSRVSKSPVTLFSDTESQKLSPIKNSWEATFVETQMNLPENPNKSPEQANRIETDSNKKSVAKVPEKRKLKSRGRKRGRATLFGDDGESEIETELVNNDIIKETQTIIPKNSARNTRTRSKSLRDDENERISLRDDENERKSLSSEKNVSEQKNVSNLFSQSTIKESGSISSEKDSTDLESCVLSRNDEINESPLNLKAFDDGTQTFSKSAVVISETDNNDVLTEFHDNSEQLECTNLSDRVEIQKRKRSISPKANECTGRSNLLVKLRALKKNCVTMKKSPTIHKTRSLSRRKLTEQSDNDDFEEATKEIEKISLISEDETNVPIKKQRIAHVPKKATNFQSDEQELSANSITSQLIESSNELIKNSDEKMTDVMKRPVTRRSAVEKLTQDKLKKDKVHVIKTGKVGRPRLLVPTNNCVVPTTTTGRRGRPPGKRNLALKAQLALDLKSKEFADSKSESTKNQVTAENDNDKLVLMNKRDIDSNNLTKDSESLLPKIQVQKNNQSIVEITEKEQISKLVTAETVKIAKDSIVQSDENEKSLTKLIHAADVSINKTEVARVLHIEKLSAANSLDSLDEILVKPTEISSLNNSSTDSPSATPIDNRKSNENLACAKNFVSINAINVTPDLLMNKTNSATSAINLDDTAQNVDILKESKNLFNDQTTNNIISKISDESPASPNSTQNSPTKDISTFEPMKREDRLSIYDEVALSIPHEKTADSISMNFYGPCVENTTKSNQFTPRDTMSNMPIEKPIERKLVVYDTNLDYESEEFDSKNIMKPQFFVENSVVKQKKIRSHSSSSIESINVVKELRSRQVLCSPSTSVNHQNLEKMENTSTDEFITDFPNETRATQPDYYTGIRSLGTLLNHHLGEQKKKRAVKNAKWRRAAATKLQKVSENNVKVELDKLVESEEWTSELHRSVVARLTDVRSERTVAKCIVDLLIERASLDEPLDRTYTPPAPVMTRTQQRIVTLMNCLNRVETMARIFDMVQTGIEYNVFKLGLIRSVETVEYLLRIFTVIARLKKDRERVRIICCDAFYFLGRRAIPAIHVILTVWPEVLPKHGTSESELPNCLAHMIKQEHIGKDPFPKILALKKMITNYYEYPQTQALSAVIMTVLIKALHEKYSSDLDVAILLISKREGTQWAIDNVIEKGLMKIIRDDNYQWQFEILNLFGFILRSFSTFDVDTSVKKFVDLLCQMLDSGEGSQDKQEGIVAALLSLSRYQTQFGKISDSVLKWMPSRDLRSITLKQLELFFKSHSPDWWNNRLQYKMKKNAVASDKNN